ncbi:hypothetical protein ARMGADRAFT_1022651 [Armillaria gallica]|uniref:Uncharacterized protein n=1 Tax=Armillaria gallica TaxID=47427 RepID=A0A2H3E9T5_ARMGA|nr:hypothetical protein ARMGADRAFT_1022651 [Armillaria gallica]
MELIGRSFVCLGFCEKIVDDMGDISLSGWAAFTARERVRNFHVKKHALRVIPRLTTWTADYPRVSSRSPSSCPKGRKFGVICGVARRVNLGLTSFIKLNSDTCHRIILAIARLKSEIATDMALPKFQYGDPRTSETDSEWIESSERLHIPEVENMQTVEKSSLLRVFGGKGLATETCLEIDSRQDVCNCVEIPNYWSQDVIERREHGIAEGFVPTMLELGMTLVESKGEANDSDPVTLTFNQYVANLESQCSPSYGFKGVIV